MSAGLFGLLDDVAAIAKLAAASVDDVGAAAGRATAKAAGVVVDDTAVTPQYVHGAAAERELPIVKKIAVGSIRNKLLIILPMALLLSEFVPELLPIILMAGGTFLAYEGAHKIWHAWHGHQAQRPVSEISPEAEKAMISGAIRTDLILSAEIMVIALNEVIDESLWAKLAILIVVAIVITVAVYGVVALIVKMDDAGLSLAQRSSAAAQRIGRALVAGMPKLLSAIAVIGTAAMLWVGGHILLVNLHKADWWDWPYESVHHVEENIRTVMEGALGSALAWLANTGISALFGVLVGFLVVGLIARLPFGEKDPHQQQSATA
ncbi:MAG: DUF808 domain-containing protein [Nocardioidaceae bacterium]|nr:DUF808 domain-containing protein [Nocardioidaceae bacterium]